MQSLATNFIEKRVKENANGIFWDNQAYTGRVTFCYSLTSRLWSVRSSYLSRLSLGAFINSTVESDHV